MIYLRKNNNKSSIKAHIADSEGRTLCNLENSSGFKPLQEINLSEIIAKDIKVCQICQNRSNFAKKPKQRKPKPKSKKDNFYSTWEWASVRYEAIKKYGPQCMCCRSRNNIVVDHIKPRSRYPDMELDPDNLQILCNLCNRGKSNKDETDWRPKETP